jgi:hypothetical protein
VLDVGKIILEFVVKIVLHRICRSHVFSIGEEQANGFASPAKGIGR